jgi:hypothetical protein
MRLKHSVVALAAAGLLAVQAHAGDAAAETAKLTPVAAASEAAQSAFSAADIETLFVTKISASKVTQECRDTRAAGRMT